MLLLNLKLVLFKTASNVASTSAVAVSSGGALEAEFFRFERQQGGLGGLKSQPQTFHLKDLLSELDSTVTSTSSSNSKSPL